MKKDIRKTIIECKKNNVKYFNKDRTKEKPRLDAKNVKKHNVLNKHIEDCINEFAIVPQKRRFVIYGKNIAQVLDKKSDKLYSVDINRMLEQKIKGIASLCITSKQRVKKVYDNMIKDSNKSFI